MRTSRRTYQRTHPWLTFRLDLRDASPALWMLLGEAQSKCEHIAGVPLRPATAQHLHQVFLAKGALATTAIEGNTLTEDQALQIVEGRLEVPPSQNYLKQEVVNIVRACNNIFDRAVRGEPSDLTPELITDFNRRVLEGLSLPEGTAAGEARQCEVSVAGYHGAPARDCSYLLEQLCAWLNSDDFQSPSGLEIVYGVLRAVLVHLYLAWIHPFVDGNGRTARLVEFQILVASGIPSPAAHLLSNYYNLTRQEYYRQLAKASDSRSDPLSFIEYAVRGFVDGLKEQLDVIRGQQWNVTWENYVHEKFRDRTSAAENRRRHLALDLSSLSAPVSLSQVTSISPRVARSYAMKSQKTLSRDIAALEKEQLILRTPQGIEANKRLILAFIPARRVPKRRPHDLV